VKPPERIEIPEGDRPRGRSATFLAVAIVVSTLVVATVEYCRTSDERQAQSAGVAAQLDGIQQQGQLSRDEEDASVRYDALAAAHDDRVRGANAFQTAPLPSIGAQEAERLRHDHLRWTQLADENDRLTPATPGVGRDPIARLKLLEVARLATNRLSALEDAANEEGAAWERRLGQYVVILTMLAIAIYLFGLSLTLTLPIRWLLTGMAVVAVTVGSGWAVGLQLTHPSRAPNAAADEYARGVFALDSFGIDPGDGSLMEADAHLSRAIALRPTFAEAYRKRADVRFALGAPVTDGFPSVTSLKARIAEIDDLQSAYDLGLRSFDTLVDLGDARYHLGLLSGQTAQFDAAVHLFDRALALDPNHWITHYDKAAALLAKGETATARAEYRAAVERTVHINDPTMEQEAVSGALTDLDELAHHAQPRASDVRAMKELVVGEVEQGHGRSVTASRVGVEVFPHALQWTATLNGYDPGKDTGKDGIFVQWYWRAAPSLDWAGLPSISREESDVGRRDDGTYFDYEATLASAPSPAHCNADGLYRVELYHEGRLVGQATSDMSNFGGVAAQRLPDLSVAYCQPRDWTASHNPGMLYGLSRGYRSASGTQGVDVFRFENLGPVNAKGVRDRVMSLLRDPQLLPGAVETAHPLMATYQQFMGLQDPSVAYFDVAEPHGRSGRLIAAAGRDTDGSVIVAIVFGTRGDFTAASSLGRTIFASFTDLLGTP